MKNFAGCLLVALSLLASGVQRCDAADEYVVIVNAANPAASISPSELRRMFLGDKTSWEGGAKVAAATPAAGTPEYGLAIKKATGMSQADFKRYMLQMTFVGKAVTLPRAFETSAALAHFVGTTPGAVACVPTAAVVAGVKVLKTD